MPIRPLLAALFLALAAPALADTAPQPPDEPPASSERTYPPERVDVPGSAWKLALLPEDHVLLEPADRGIILEHPGREPRQAIRYLPERDATMRFFISARPKIVHGAPGKPNKDSHFPAVRLDCTATIIAAFPDSFEVLLTVDSVDLKSVNRSLPEGAEDAIPRMYKARTVSIIADNRGRIINLDVSEPELAHTPPLLTLESIARRLIVPLPEEPVGIGAVWNLPRTTQLELNLPGSEHTLSIRDRYKLEDFVGGSLLKVTVETCHDQIPTGETRKHPAHGWDVQHRAIRIENSGTFTIPLLPAMPPLGVTNEARLNINSMAILDTLRNRHNGVIDGTLVIYEQAMHATIHPSDHRKYFAESVYEYRRLAERVMEEHLQKQAEQPADTPHTDPDQN